MDKDALIQEYRRHASSWQAVGGVYVLILRGLVFSAAAIL